MDTKTVFFVLLVTVSTNGKFLFMKYVIIGPTIVERERKRGGEGKGRERVVTYNWTCVFGCYSWHNQFC